MSRQFFLAYLTALIGILLGTSTGLWSFGKKFQKKRIEQQIYTGRLRFVSLQKLKEKFGKQIGDAGLQLYHDNVIIDKTHFARTDQAYDLLQRLLSLLDYENDGTINIDISDLRMSSGKKRQHIRIEGNISIVSELGTTLETIQKLFKDLVLCLRDHTEQAQYDDFLLQQFGATAGVPSDINANILLAHLAIYLSQNHEYMQKIQKEFGTYDEQQQTYVIDFTNPKLIDKLLGTHHYQYTPDTQLINYLGGKRDITPQDLSKNQYPGLELDVNIHKPDGTRKPMITTAKNNRN